MSYGENARYTNLNKWDIFFRESPNAPWSFLHTEYADPSARLSALNERLGYQGYSVSRQTRWVG